MEGLWVNNRRQIEVPEERPVLDSYRSKIISYDKIFNAKDELQALIKNGHFGYMIDRGYQIIGEIGRGGYGVVYKARSLEQTGKFYAIKINFDVVARSTIYLEVAFFHLVRKKNNLPKIVDFFLHVYTPHIVLEYFQHQQYIEIFDQINTLTEVKHYMIQVLKGVNTLKGMGIFHRDIKPQNFLYNLKSKKGIIIDLGLAQVDPTYIKQVIQRRYEDIKNQIPIKERTKNKTFIDRKEQYNVYRKILKANHDHGFHKIGTQSYVPLQSIIHAPGQGHQCEIWSVGVIMLQFMCQKLHFFNEPKIQNVQPGQQKYLGIFVMELAHMYGVQKIKEHLRKIEWDAIFPADMPAKGDLKKMICLKSQKKQENDQAYDLLTKLLKLEPQERITAEDAIWHPFFDEVRKQHFTSYSQKRWYRKQLQKRFPSQKKQQQKQQQKQDQISQKSSFNNPSSVSKNNSKSAKNRIQSSYEDDDQKKGQSKSKENIKNKSYSQEAYQQQIRSMSKKLTPLSQSEKNQRIDLNQDKQDRVSNRLLQKYQKVVKLKQKQQKIQGFQKFQKSSQRQRIVIQSKTVQKKEERIFVQGAVQVKQKKGIMEQIRTYLNQKKIPKKSNRIQIQCYRQYSKPKNPVKKSIINRIVHRQQTQQEEQKQKPVKKQRNKKERQKDKKDQKQKQKAKDKGAQKPKRKYTPRKKKDQGQKQKPSKKQKDKQPSQEEQQFVHKKQRKRKNKQTQMPQKAQKSQKSQKSYKSQNSQKSQKSQRSQKLSKSHQYSHSAQNSIPAQPKLSSHYSQHNQTYKAYQQDQQAKQQQLRNAQISQPHSTPKLALNEGLARILKQEQERLLEQDDEQDEGDFFSDRYTEKEREKERERQRERQRERERERGYDRSSRSQSESEAPVGRNADSGFVDYESESSEQM